MLLHSLLGTDSICILGRGGLSKSCCLLFPSYGEDVVSIEVPSSSKLSYCDDSSASWGRDFESDFHSDFSEQYELSS